MPGFVWVKTMIGARTAGFFALHARDDKLYASDGTNLEPPPGSVMISGEELMTAINKSAPKGIYVCAWKATQNVWSQYLHEAWNEHLDAYSLVDGAITKIAASTGMLSPHNSSKEVLAEKMAGVKARKDKVERDFKDSITTALQILKPMTVRALGRARPLAAPLACASSRALGRVRACVRTVVRTLTCALGLASGAQSGRVYRFYCKEIDMNQRNTRFMVENRLTSIISPNINTCNQIAEIYSDDDEWAEYLKLCTKLNLAPPSQMQEQLCQHYVIKKNNKVVAGMSTLTANINNSNRSICVSVELLVSGQKGSAQLFYNVISKSLKKRAGTCYIVTQSLESAKASEFWYKHMARHREADALTFMFFMLDNRYKLYEKVINLRTTF